MFWAYPATTSETWWLSSSDFQTIRTTYQAMVAYDPLRTAERVKLGYGYGETFIHGGGQKVRISYSMGEDEDLADEHVALVSQLREGHPVSFAQYVTDLWAFPLDSGTGRTSTAGHYTAATNPFTNYYVPIVAPVNGTTCIVQSSLPELKREVIKLTAVNTGTRTVTIEGRGTHGGLVYTYSTTTDMGLRPFIRPMYFFPFLRLMPGQSAILRQEQGMPWSFDAWFTCDVGMESEVIGA